jgi:DNA polymerase-1
MPCLQALLGRSQLSHADRQLGKLINFGVVYGMGARALAGAAGIDLPAASAFLKRFQRELYPAAALYLERCKLGAVVQGRVQVSGGQVQVLLGEVLQVALLGSGSLMASGCT